MAVAILANMVITTALLWSRHDASFRTLMQRVAGRSLLVAYGCFAVAGLLCSSLVRPTMTAVLQLTAIFFLSSFVIRSANHQQERERLREALAGADERASFGHAMEAVLHRLKNLLSIARTNLDEAIENQKGSGWYVERAASALTDAANILRDVGVEGRTLFTPHFDPLDLRQLATDVVQEMQATSRRGGVSLSVSAEPHDFSILGDAGLIRDVLVNLTKNGIEHAGAGGSVAVVCECRANGWPAVRVVDSGPGVPVSALDTLFVGRGSETSTGAGLGLVASYMIARQHYGKLLYEGGQRRGAVFTLEVPPRVELERRLGRQRPLASKGLRTLQ